MTIRTYRTSILAALAAAALLATGCGGDHASQVLGGDTGGGGADDAALVKAIEEAAVVADTMTAVAIAAETAAVQGDPAVTAIGRPTPANVERSVERTLPCPAGGELIVGGTLNGMFDRDTRTLELDGGGSREANGCMLERDGSTITIDGASSWSWARRFVDGMPDGLQTRSASGSWTATRDDGTTRSCAFDYSISYDPATRELTVDGELCGGPLRPGLGWKTD